MNNPINSLYHLDNYRPTIRRKPILVFADKHAGKQATLNNFIPKRYNIHLCIICHERMFISYARNKQFSRMAHQSCVIQIRRYGKLTKRGRAN